MKKLNDRILRSDIKKIIIFWSPKAGCSTTIQMFFEYINYEYNKDLFIHESRNLYELENNIAYLPNNHEDYHIMQVVRNSYSRAVSSYLTSTTRNDDYYKNFYIDNKKIITIPNNLSFLEFLELIENYYNNIENSENIIIDPHYDVQTMINSQIPINLKNIIHLEKFKENIESFNKKYNLNLNSNIKYDIHNHSNPLSDYFIIHRKKPMNYKEYYKDIKAKKLVDKIYGIDIENFKFNFEL